MGSLKPPSRGSSCLEMTRPAQGGLEFAGTGGCLTAIGRMTLPPKCMDRTGQRLHCRHLLYWEQDGGVGGTERH